MHDNTRSIITNHLAVFLLILFTCLFPCLSYASSMGVVVCAAANIVTGEVAAAISTLGICTLGAGACFGKISWPLAITVCAGIGAIFGTANILLNMWGFNGCPP